MKNLLLKGTLGGITKIRKLVNPDIIKSSLMRMNCLRNRFSIRRSQSGKIIVYHSFSCNKKGYTGRWYCGDLCESNHWKLNKKTRSFVWNAPEWTNWKDNSIKKNVLIRIFFTEKGWNKLTKFLEC